MSKARTPEALPSLLLSTSRSLRFRENLKSRQLTLKKLRKHSPRDPLPRKRRVLSDSEINTRKKEGQSPKKRRSRKCSRRELLPKSLQTRTTPTSFPKRKWQTPPSMARGARKSRRLTEISSRPKTWGRPTTTPRTQCSQTRT